jgi:hypothetical protein
MQVSGEALGGDACEVRRGMVSMPFPWGLTDVEIGKMD